MIGRYLAYYFNAKTIYNIHSPFLFDFITHNFDTTQHYYPYDEIEYLRTQILQSDISIQHIEHGAGSQVNKNTTLKLGTIAKNAVSPFNQAKVLFNIVKNRQPNEIIELGTSLGISTLYLAKANKKAKVYTIEGSPEIANVARNHFKQLKANNIQLETGVFEEKLSICLSQMNQVDLAFVDGNHTYESTLSYYRTILSKCNENSILIFDDIHWSKGMEKAWNEIIQSSEVSCSIDAFYFGIVFFDKKIRENENLSYIPFKYKPWKIGLFN